MSTPSQFVTSALSPARAAMRQRLIEATVELATEGGHTAVTIRAVAARAGVSVPTVYHHASSPDALLAEALLVLGRRSTERVREHAPEAGTPRERITAQFRLILDQARAKPLLYQALYRAFVAYGTTSAESGLPAGSGLGMGPERAEWIGEALAAGDPGEHSPEDLAWAARILSCLFLGAMVGVASGRDPDEALAILNETARRLLP